MRDGQPLTDSSHFSGTATAMLLINQASLGAEGEYSCQVRCGQKRCITEPALLRLLYPPEKKILISRYKKSREIPGSSWPPGTCNIYVELIMIKKSKVKKPSHLVIEEEIEALLVNQEIISFNKTFDIYLSGAIFLVEGRPGSGKTTLANKIVKDWSQGKALRNADKVFLISLRRDLNRSQIFKLFYHSQYQKYMEDIEESGGENVCFVLDGYDEFSPQDKNNSVFEDILSKKYLPESMVIVTSRSEAALSLRQNANMNIELLGFTKEHFKLYIKNYPFETSSDSNKEEEIRLKLYKYVKSCMNVLNICYLPINASIICFLFSQHLGDEPPPKTESQIYEALIVAIVLRKMKSQNPSAQLHSLKDLTGENKTTFNKICLLAYTMTITNTQILPIPLDALKNNPLWELFAPDSIIELYGVEDVISFIHLTLQEYLAAYYLASLGEDKQTEVIRTFAGSAHHMKTTFKFYCGLIDYDKQKEQYQNIFSCIPVSHNMLYLAHCVYESQQLELGKAAINLLNGKISLQFTTLTLADFTVLDYVISAAPQMINGLDITTCQLYEECIADLFEKRLMDVNKMFNHGPNSAFGLSDVIILMKISPFMRISYKKNALFRRVNVIAQERFQYYYYYHRIKLDRMESRNPYNCSSDHLDRLKSDHFDIHNAKEFVHPLLKCTNLKTIELSYNPSITHASVCAGLLNNTPKLQRLIITDIAGESMVSLGKGLQHCKELLMFDISESHCLQEGSTALADGLKHCKSLRSFTMQGTSLGSEGAIKLAGVLKSLPLHSISFASCDMGHDGLVALATEGCFSHTTNILDVWENAQSETMSIVIQNMAQNICALLFRGNNILSDDMTSIAQRINSSNLVCLNFNFSPIGSEGAAALGTGLYNCCNLSKLALSGCNITSDGIPALIRGFKYWERLTYLDLCDNQLSIITALSEQLRMVPLLEELCVAHNMIDYKGARAVAKGIKNCRFLKIFHINHNIIGSVGAAAISNALKDFSMKFINFSNNSIDLENELLLINLVNLAKHKTLELLDLSHNAVGPDNTLRLIVYLTFYLPVLNIATTTVIPELLEFVTTFKKTWTSPKIYIT